MIIPLTILPRLQIGLRQKLAVVVMFVLGFIIVAFSITRVVESLKDLPSTDAGSKYFLYTQIEASVAVIVCNLPVIRILQKYLARQLRPGGKYSGDTSSASRANAVANTSSEAYPESGIGVVTSTRLSFTTIPDPADQPMYLHQGKSEDVLLHELPKIDDDSAFRMDVSIEHQGNGPTRAT